ncbi:MAG: DedA family protein [Candidatus Brocadiaceae bacterium]|nr:DedA family protein [Candidatus Brocadiaceae bacterium]
MNHTEQLELPQTRKAGIHRRLYDWTLHWAHTPYGSIALFVLAFCESSFFPIPPDVLLMALAFSIAKKSFKYAAICSFGSILGGCFGYFIGYGLFDLAGQPILNALGLMDKFTFVKEQYTKNAFAAVAIAGFTPIPYKVFTIAAGVCTVNFWTFLIASTISRAGRFFIIAGIVFLFGPKIKGFIDKYFNILSIAFVLLIIIGFLIIKLIK